MYGFLVGVELVEGIASPEQIALRLAESLAFVEGVGKIDVENLGKLDIYYEEKE